MKLMTPIAILAVGVASVAFGQSSNDSDKEAVVQKIIQLETQWGDAMVKGDVAACDKVIAPDYVDYGSDGSLQTRAEADADLASGAYKLIAYKFDDIKVRVFGETAVLFGLETEKSTYKGVDSSSQYRFVDIYAKRDGAWMAVATQVVKVKK